MKYRIISKPIDVSEIDSTGEAHYTYMVYLTDDNRHPIEAHETFGDHDRNAIISMLLDMYTPDVIEVTHKTTSYAHLDD